MFPLKLATTLNVTYNICYNTDFFKNMLKHRMLPIKYVTSLNITYNICFNTQCYLYSMLQHGMLPVSFYNTKCYLCLICYNTECLLLNMIEHWMLLSKYNSPHNVTCSNLTVYLQILPKCSKTFEQNYDNTESLIFTLQAWNHGRNVRLQPLRFLCQEVADL